jgi:hypothetical protein
MDDATKAATIAQMVAASAAREEASSHSVQISQPAQGSVTSVAYASDHVEVTAEEGYQPAGGESGTPLDASAAINSLRHIDEQITYLQSKVDDASFKPNGERVHRYSEGERASFQREITALKTNSRDFALKQYHAAMLAEANKAAAATEAEQSAVARQQRIREKAEALAEQQEAEELAARIRAGRR